MLINNLPRYEILDEGGLAELERGWRRIVSDLGIEFLHPEALEYLRCEGAWADRRNGLPRLVLLDLKMPRMDGLEVLRKLKQDPRTRTIPVVMMTSSREEGDLVASYSLGVNSYIVKPVDFDKLVAAVSEIGFYWLLLNHPPA